jgi:putative ATP-binding cassette transporter
MALLAGLSNALVLALINSAADLASREPNGSLFLGLLFVGAVTLYTIAQSALMIRAAKEVEALTHGFRVRLIDKMRQSELADIDNIGRSRIFNAVSKEIQTLAQISATLAVALQMAVLVVFTTLYLMTLSMTAFFLAVGFMSVAITIYLRRVRHANAAMKKAAEAEYGLHDHLTGILDGFKEIKLNDMRSRDVADDLVRASLDAANERVKAETGYARNLVFSQNVFFLLLGTMVFVVPVLSSADAYSDSLLKTTTSILFVIGPIAGLVGAVPLLANANTSATYILDLERLLDESAGPQGTRDHHIVRYTSFAEIELRDVAFRFAEKPGQYAFAVGPLNLKIAAGQTIFVSGGNGSGKSTFLRLLTTLYWPQQGTILLDGKPVTHADTDSYRSLFSAVFSDYHLFKRLYGIDSKAAAEAAALLELFELDEVTSVDRNEFSTIELSAGQRKRLALIVALLERRPICILDEWAADQDPVFRRKFYTELLRRLKERGITVIAVSHDDRYYQQADIRLHMEEGRFVGQVPETRND